MQDPAPAAVTSPFWLLALALSEQIARHRGPAVA